MITGQPYLATLLAKSGEARSVQSVAAFLLINVMLLNRVLRRHDLQAALLLIWPQLTVDQWNRAFALAENICLRMAALSTHELSATQH
jgi:hypothetical protein